MPEETNNPFQRRAIAPAAPRSAVTSVPPNRTNYGLAPRPVQTPNVGMDIISSRPLPTPMPVPIVAPTTQASPYVQPVPLEPAATPTITSAQTKAVKQRRPWLVAVGAVLCLFGAGLWVSSGGLSSRVTTTGAVTADSLATSRGSGTYAVHIQFAATDGQLHYLTLYSRQPTETSGYILGKAVPIAYNPKSPSTSGVLASSIDRPRDVSFASVLLGIFSFGAYGLQRRRKSRLNAVADSGS